ncbi:MAG TPA: glycoside hydrolase family 57 protein [Bacteroidales bacterium]|nr:glycoside hydrolase family 57 protein [Bacteroidales bacterium]HOK98796.1 glycoside hydrolase family 57 protein [Bacteroidales bacterium]HPO64960.1 glycoside hydrolase family 57 protein [Bacteroidales bacterium]
MKTICLYFQVHQPFRFRKYRFFEIGNEHYYYDDYANESFMRKVASKSYLPTNKILLDLIKEYGSRFKVAFSISGTALDQFELYAPEVLESFQKLAATNSVEFLSETYSHTLASLINKDEFIQQIVEHDEKIEKLFGKKPTVFRNTELIYNNEIGDWLAELGFKAVLTEGARHILGWKSPNYVYASATNPRLKLLLKNSRLSDDIAFRFSNRGWDQYPLTADKFVGWIKAMDPKEDTLNLFMNYDTFGNIQPKESGIFEFLKAFPKEVFKTNQLTFSTPSEVVERFQPVAPLSVQYPISWADEERDVSAWLGNELQQEAFNKLFALRNKVLQCNNPQLKLDWKYLQCSDHFYYMSTKFFIHGSLYSYFNPYNSPYEAFIYYMNILSDFEIRIHQCAEASSKAITEEPQQAPQPKTSRAKSKKTENTTPQAEEKKKVSSKKSSTRASVAIEKEESSQKKKATTKKAASKSKKSS